MSRPDAMANRNPCSFRPALGVSVAIVCFLAGRSAVGAIFHVDDDAVNDPAPGNPLVSDQLEDGSSDHPFDSFQEAIGAGNPSGFHGDEADLDGNGATNEPLPLDLDDSLRIKGLAGDMGAYELGVSGPAIPALAGWGMVIMVLVLLAVGSLGARSAPGIETITGA